MLRLPSIALVACASCGLAWAGQTACGGAERAPAPTTDSDGPLTANPEDREVVAEVDGVPIYADCVARQAEHGGIDKAAALSQCIDFELLAQEAQRRGFSRATEVREVGRREAVRALLDQQIVAPMPSLEKTDRSILEEAYKRYRSKIYAPERRRIFHLFAPFPELRERPGTEADKQARAMADELHAALAERRGLTPDEVYRVAEDVAGDRPLGPTDDKTGEFRREIFKIYRNQPNMPRGFSHAALDIPEPGMVSPPARSDYGWHIILYLDGEPAKFANVDQSAEYLFQAVRAERFWNYTGKLLEQAEIAVDETELVELQEREDSLLPPESGADATDGAGAEP